MDRIVFNEQLLFMREASTQAMIEAQKRKAEKDKQISTKTEKDVNPQHEIILQPSKKEVLPCNDTMMDDGSISLICAIAFSIITK